MPQTGTLKEIYDHIRMLDAETYPPAFLDYGQMRYTFSEACLMDEGVSARVKITQRKS
jgi:methionyl-tRNA formyltransferase